MSLFRSRLVFLAVSLATMGLGLIWRDPWLGFSRPVQKYGADALWALLIYFGLRLIRPDGRIWIAAAVALLFATAVEFGQLYQAPWIHQLRATRLGTLILGSVFNWPDLPAYAGGIAFGALLETTLRRNRRRAPAAGA